MTSSEIILISWEHLGSHEFSHVSHVFSVLIAIFSHVFSNSVPTLFSYISLPFSLQNSPRFSVNVSQRSQAALAKTRLIGSPWPIPRRLPQDMHMLWSAALFCGEPIRYVFPSAACDRQFTLYAQKDVTNFQVYTVISKLIYVYCSFSIYTC